VIKYFLDCAWLFFINGRIERTLWTKENAKAFLLEQAPLSFATRAANICWYFENPGAIHFKAIRIFTRNGYKNAKPVVNHWACVRTYAYHGGLFFHAACSMGRDARNANRRLWALWPLIPARKARKRFLEHTLLFAFRKTYPIFTLGGKKPLGHKGI